MTTVDPSLATNPAAFRMATAETYPLGFDTTAALAEAGSDGPPTSPVVVLTDLTTGKPVTLADDPTISGNVIVQIVRGSALTVQHRYTLAVGFTITDVTIPLMVLTITCVPTQPNP